MKAEKKDCWDKLKILSFIAIPLVIAYFGHLTNTTIKNKDFEARRFETAVGILGSESPIAQAWAERHFEETTVSVPQTREEAKEIVISENLIQNGNFTSPLMESKSWGHGLHTDKYKTQYPNAVWINFVNADISILVVNTVKGNALKIDHKSERHSHKVGIIEQYIQVKPGKYKFAFWAKADNLQENALQFTTTDKWDTNSKNGGYALNKSGSFDWQLFEEDIEIKEGGRKTFTIASMAKGISYITGISLTKSNK